VRREAPARHQAHVHLDAVAIIRSRGEREGTLGAVLEQTALTLAM
jgi:hypothetical protein